MRQCETLRPAESFERLRGCLGHLLLTQTSFRSIRGNLLETPCYWQFLELLLVGINTLYHQRGNMSIPYTYFLMWKSTGMKYYGCQHGKFANPENILTHKYKTSSHRVRQYWGQNGPPDIIVIHRIFANKSECLAFEHQYLKRVGAVKKKDWINLTDNKAISTDTYSSDSWKKSHESRNNHIANDPEFKQKLATKFIENMHSEKASSKRRQTFASIGHCKGENNPRFGIKVSGTDLAQKISNTRKAQKDLNQKNAERLNSLKFTCEHCGKPGLSAGNYKRWHHLNCKSRK